MQADGVECLTPQNNAVASIFGILVFLVEH